MRLHENGVCTAFGNIYRKLRHAFSVALIQKASIRRLDLHAHGTSYSFKMDRKHFTLLQLHLVAICSCHAFNIQAIRIRACCAAVSKAFETASHQHQPGSQNHKQENDKSMKIG